MKSRQFSPGFKFTRIDMIIVPSMLIAISTTANYSPLLGWILTSVCFNFFLFCNVFRVKRLLELLWAASFIAIMANIQLNPPATYAALSTLQLLSTVAIILQTRSASYHGVLWQKINPSLPEWWSEHTTTHTSAP